MSADTLSQFGVVFFVMLGVVVLFSFLAFLVTFLALLDDIKFIKSVLRDHRKGIFSVQSRVSDLEGRPKPLRSYSKEDAL